MRIFSLQRIIITAVLLAIAIVILYATGLNTTTLPHLIAAICIGAIVLCLTDMTDRAIITWRRRQDKSGGQ